MQRAVEVRAAGKTSSKRKQLNRPSAAVLRRAQRGDRKALETFFCWHLPMLKKWAAPRIPRWLERHADADDFVQRAALKTLMRLDHLSPDREATIQPFMRQVLLNLVRDEVRKVGRSPERSELSGDEADAAGESALDTLVERATARTYRAAFRQLTERERTAIIGRLQRGLPYDRLRGPLHVATAGAARAVVRRALEKLVTLIAEAETTAATR